MANSLLLSLRKSTNVRIKELSVSLLRLGMAATQPLSPGLAAKWAAQLFLTPYRHTQPAREVVLQQSAEQLKIDSEFGPLSAWSWGAGPIVLLVHGWEGRGAQLGSFVKPLVAAGYRVVAFDGPGHGISAGNRSSLVAMSRAVLTVAKKLGKIEAIIAHSMGAAATTLALSRGLEANRLIYLAPPISAIRYARYFGEFIGLSPRVSEQMQRIIEQIYQFSWAELDGVRLAKQMNAPLLVFHDIDDRDVPWRDGEALAKAWPNAILITTAGLGHRRILHQQDITNSATSFIKGDDDLYSLLLSASVSVSQQRARKVVRHCATPDCENSLTDSLDRNGQYCSNCLIERELYDSQSRWQPEF